MILNSVKLTAANHHSSHEEWQPRSTHSFHIYKHRYLCTLPLHMCTHTHLFILPLNSTLACERNLFVVLFIQAGAVGGNRKVLEKVVENESQG